MFLHFSWWFMSLKNFEESILENYFLRTFSVYFGVIEKHFFLKKKTSSSHWLHWTQKFTKCIESGKWTVCISKLQNLNTLWNLYNYNKFHKRKMPIKLTIVTILYKQKHFYINCLTWMKSYQPEGVIFC